MSNVVEAIQAAYSDLDFANWAALERLLPHALTCATWIEQARLGDPFSARLLDQTGYYLFKQARYGEAEPLLQRALQIREEILGPEDPDVATSLNNLAEVYNRINKYAEAERLLERALQIREKVLGAEHPDVAASLINLAEHYAELNQYIKAEPLFQRAIAIDEQVYGSEHPEVATDINNLAKLYSFQGRHEEAKPLLERALQIHEQWFGTEQSSTALSLWNLAMNYLAQGKYAEAKPLMRKACIILKQVLGPEHPQVVDFGREYDLLLLREELRSSSDWESRQSQQSNAVAPRRVNRLTRVIENIALFTKKHHYK